MSIDRKQIIIKFARIVLPELMIKVVSGVSQLRATESEINAAHRAHVMFCFLAVLDPRVGHTMDVLSPFVPVLCHSD